MGLTNLLPATTLDLAPRFSAHTTQWNRNRRRLDSECRSAAQLEDGRKPLRRPGGAFAYDAQGAGTTPGRPEYRLSRPKRYTESPATRSMSSRVVHRLVLNGLGR